MAKKEALLAVPARMARLRHVTRFLYDVQKLRIQSGNRNSSEGGELEQRDRDFLSMTAANLEDIEKTALKEVARLLKGIPVYEQFLKQQRGVGPTISAVLLSYFDPHKAPKPSSFWNYAGLSVDVETGKATSLRAGEKANYNPFLKSKVLKVLGDSFIKSKSPWAKEYYNYKHRKENQRVPVCAGCLGTGKYKASKQEIRRAEIEKTEVETGTCSNCQGTGGPAPWGRSQKHRHQAAVRYMVKIFLFYLWKAWREAEGLEVRPMYSEEFLGHKHHDGYPEGAAHATTTPPEDVSELSAELLAARGMFEPDEAPLGE